MVAVKPVVTIGVCVRNCASTITEAIESIMNQDYPHQFMEAIFVDDGSADKTLSIVNSYASKMDLHVKVFHHGWKGLGPTRNRVVENARGKYIVWVDGDMLLPRDHVRKQVDFMEKNPSVGVAKARYGILPGKNSLDLVESAGIAAVDSMYGGGSTSRALGTAGCIYRVEAIRQVGGFDVHLRGVGEDMDAEDRIRKRGWLLYLATSAVFYERRRNSLRSIWREGFWWGYGACHIFRKNKKMFALHKMNPLAALSAGIWYSTIAYKLTRRKIVFLLPLQYAFKMVAWCLGFIRGQIDGYKHGVVEVLTI